MNKLRVLSLRLISGQPLGFLASRKIFRNPFLVVALRSREIQRGAIALPIRVPGSGKISSTGLC